MNYPKLLLLIISVILLVVACKKETAEPPKEPVNNGPVYYGGKNGWYSRTFYAVKDGVRVNARAYLKYAAIGPPADSSLYDEIKDISPGKGARFDSLDYGTYYILLKAGNDTTDAMMEITPSTLQQFEVSLPFR